LWDAGETFKTDVYLLNDTQNPLIGLTYHTRLVRCDGEILAEKSGSAETAVNISTKIGEVELKIPDSLKGSTFFVSAELLGTSGKISDALCR
jgi:hypothetical protein